MNIPDLFSLFDLKECEACTIFDGLRYPWEALPRLAAFIAGFTGRFPGSLKNDFEQIASGVWAAKDAKIAPTACILGPAIIGRGSEIRHGAFLRENVILGDNCVVGNSSEVKNALLFNGVQIPHFNYAGDSILGYKAHLGAGVKISNVKSDFSPVTVRFDGKRLETGLAKFGALVGDFAEVGCNAVLNPGSIIGKNSTVYPLLSVRGFVPSDTILKGTGELVQKQ